MGASAYENPREIYSTGSSYLDNWYLVDFTCEEKTDTATTIVNNSQGTFYVECPRTQYIFTQVVRLTFTDRESYAASDRVPATSMSEWTSNADSLSKVDLADAAALVYSSFTGAAKINHWMQTKHEFTMDPEGVFNVDIHYIAYSDFIWNRAKCHKVMMSAMTKVTATSPEVPSS